MVQGSSHNLSAFIEDYLQCIGGIELIPEDTDKVFGANCITDENDDSDSNISSINDEIIRNTVSDIIQENTKKIEKNLNSNIEELYKMINEKDQIIQLRDAMTLRYPRTFVVGINFLFILEEKKKKVVLNMINHHSLHVKIITLKSD